MTTPEPIDFKMAIRAKNKIHPEVYEKVVEYVKSIDADRFADFILKGKLTDADEDQIVSGIRYILYQCGQVGKLMTLMHEMSEDQRAISLQHAQAEKNAKALEDRNPDLQRDPEKKPNVD